jgi:hypothetical protein
MIVLTEQIEIPASYEKLKAWTANFEEEFVKWSPYHIECNLYNGNYNAGSKIRFREIVMGLDYDVTGTITECEQDENGATRKRRSSPLKGKEPKQDAISLTPRLSA